MFLKNSTTLSKHERQKMSDDVKINQKCRMKLQWGKKGRASLERLESQGDLQALGVSGNPNPKWRTVSDFVS